MSEQYNYSWRCPICEHDSYINHLDFYSCEQCGTMFQSLDYFYRSRATPKMIKELKEITGCSLSDCHKAFKRVDHDKITTEEHLNKAKNYLGIGQQDELTYIHTKLNKLTSSTLARSFNAVSTY